jgi:hypothetical protein
VKHNRFIQLAGGTRSVDREVEAKARALAGIRGYITNLRACQVSSRRVSRPGTSVRQARPGGAASW